MRWSLISLPWFKSAQPVMTASIRPAHTISVLIQLVQQLVMSMCSKISHHRKNHPSRWRAVPALGTFQGNSPRSGVRAFGRVGTQKYLLRYLCISPTGYRFAVRYRPGQEYLVRLRNDWWCVGLTRRQATTLTIPSGISITTLNLQLTKNSRYSPIMQAGL